MAYDKADEKKGRCAKNRTKLFTKGVFILTAANIVIKLAGLLFKVPMNYIVGDTGMGYYGSAYSIYTFLYMLSTAGLPVAVSIMVAEGRSAGRFMQVRKVFRTALLIFCAVGCVGSGAMLIFAGRLAALIGSEPSVFCIAAIAPTLLFICISSAFRGYFQGCEAMIPIAVSQLIEALGKLILGIGAALYSIRMGYGIHVTAAYAVSGVSVGSLIGMLYLMAAKLFFRDPREGEGLHVSAETTSSAALLKRFAAISLPITVSSSVMSLSGMIDTVLIQRMLRLSGMGQEAATTLYGNYTSLALPMFNLPPVLIYPITCALIPLLTSARAVVDMKQTGRLVTSSLRAAVLIGMPCAIGLASLSYP
ncbi:MAG: polysaccharide biosynthesis protein, partial [Ruminococcaceae bacterium]|nr:polysaccharide biosynthesis protein [Oscillospiraceae bacterium]